MGQISDLLLEPIDLGPLRMRNRLAMSAHTGALPHDRYVAYIAERSAGGVGMVAVGGANAGLAEYGPLRGMWTPGAPPAFDFVGPNPATKDGIAYYDDTVIPMLRERADAVRAGGALSFGQVFHLGSYREVDNLHVGIGPSAGPDPDGFGTTYELTSVEIEELVTAYAASVRRVKLAGLDGAELHAAHGFLIQAFLNPATNRRVDEWGDRTRFLRRVLEASREAVGPDFPIGLRVGAETVDLIGICRAVEADLAYISVSGGSVSGTRDGLAYASTRFEEPGHNLAVAAAVRKAVRVPVLAAGRILTPERAAEAIGSGACDVVAMARPFIADPDYVRKLADGRAADIRPCISANECHMYHGARSHMTCAVNPRAGREVEGRPARSASARSVLVVGAGPAGMEAAAVAALAGHRVTLVDRADDIGGRLALLARDPSQDRLLDYLEYSRRRLDGVELRLGREQSADELLATDPDVVIVATGSESPPGLSYERVLVGDAAVGRRVLVVGGLEDHVETLAAAALLSGRGHDVEVITEWDRHGVHADPMTRIALLRTLRSRGVVLRTGVRFTGDAFTDVFTGRPMDTPYFDSVVLVGGRTARTGLLNSVRRIHPRVVAIGDCLVARRVVHAVLDGHRAASALDGPISRLQ